MRAYEASWWSPIVVILLALLFGVSFLVLVDLTLTWLVLLLLALGAFVLAVWSGDPTRALYSAFVVTVSIGISKGLVEAEGIQGAAISLSDPFLFGFLALWLSDKLLVRRERFLLDPAIVGALVLTLYLGLSIAWSLYPFGGSLAFVSQLKTFLVLVAVVDYVRSPALIRVTFVAIAVGLCIHLAMVGAQVLAGGPIEIQGFKGLQVMEVTFAEAGGSSAFRPSGFLGHPNALGGYLSFLIPPLLALVLLGRRHVGRAWFVSLLLLTASVVALVLSLSRQAWIANAVAVALLLTLGYRRGLIRAGQVKVLVTAAVGATALVLVAYPAALLRITETDQRSTQSRLLMNEHALLIIKNNPVLGVGLGSYSRAARANIPESFAYIQRGYREDLVRGKGVVHNKWLLVAAELGVVGLALFLVAIWLPLWRYLRQRTWLDPAYAMLALGLFCSLAGTLVVYTFDHWRIDVSVDLYWLFMAFLLVVLRIQETGELPLARA